MSLIQERHHIQSALTWSRVRIAFGSLGIIAAGYFAISEDLGMSTVMIFVYGVVFLGTGIYTLAKTRRRREIFEAEHGPDAGKQKPIT